MTQLTVFQLYKRIQHARRINNIWLHFCCWFLMTAKGKRKLKQIIKKKAAAIYRSSTLVLMRFKESIATAFKSRCTSVYSAFSVSFSFAPRNKKKQNTESTLSRHQRMKGTADSYSWRNEKLLKKKRQRERTEDERTDGHECAEVVELERGSTTG